MLAFHQYKGWERSEFGPTVGDGSLGIVAHAAGHRLRAGWCPGDWDRLSAPQNSAVAALKKSIIHFFGVFPHQDSFLPIHSGSGVAGSRRYPFCGIESTIIAGAATSRRLNIRANWWRDSSAELRFGIGAEAFEVE